MTWAANARGSFVRELERLGIRRRVLDGGHVALGLDPGVPVRQDLRRDPAQVLDEPDLEHHGPRPQLSDRERRDGLKRGDEACEAVEVESGVAVRDQIERHRVDAGRSFEVGRGELRKLGEVPPRQVAPDVDDLGFDQVVVVEQPLARRLLGATGPRIGREDHVDVVKDARVFVDARVEAALAAAPASGKRETTREGSRASLEAFDAQDLRAKRTLVRMITRTPAALVGGGLEQQASVRLSKWRADPVIERDRTDCSDLSGSDLVTSPSAGT